MKSKGLTVILSFLPGLGHMYLGYTNYGVQMMITFFGLCWLSGIIWIAGLAIPVLWFYNMFDAIKKCDKYNFTVLQNPNAQPDDINSGIYTGVNIGGKNTLLIVCAIVLILAGVNVLISDVLNWVIPQRLIYLFKNLFFSALFIAGGIYVLYRSTKGGFITENKNPLEPEYKVGQPDKEEKINKEDKI